MTFYSTAKENARSEPAMEQTNVTVEVLTPLSPGTSKVPKLQEPVAATISASFAILAIFINGLILASFKRDARLQVTFNFYVYNLAIADLIHCFIVLINIARSCLNFFTEYTQYVCLLMEFLTQALALQEFLLVHLMSRDRYLAVKRGLNYRRKGTRVGMQSQFSIGGSDHGSRPPHSYLREGSSRTGHSLSTVGTGTFASSDLQGDSVVTTSLRRTSRDTVNARPRSSSVSIASLQVWVKEKVGVYVTWITSCVFGFFIAEIGTAIYESDGTQCFLPERFLYLHNSSYLHAVLLTTLFISFLFIVKERWSQKHGQLFYQHLRCCGYTERKGYLDFNDVYSNYSQTRMSLNMLRPRSPVHSLAAPKHWFNIEEKTGIFKETDLDTYISHSNRSDNGKFSYRHQHDNALLAVESTSSSSTGERCILLNKSVLTFSAKKGTPEKEALFFTDTDENELSAEKNSPRKKNLGKISLSFERRYRGISGHHAFENEDIEDCLATISSDDYQTAVPPLSQNQNKSGGVGLELIEGGLEMYKTDSCSIINERDITLQMDIPNSFAKSKHTEEMHLKKSQAKKKLVDGKGKFELHKSLRIFKSIDKYYLDMPTKSIASSPEERSDKTLETAFGLNVKDRREGPGTISANTDPLLPAISFSDDEMPIVQGKARTDSLYTLRSCMSIPEENDPADPDFDGGEMSFSCIMGKHSDIDFIAPLSTKKTIVGSSTAVDMSHRHSEIEDTKTVIFTIGDGNEDFSEDDEIEKRWQGWDHLFSCDTIRHANDNAALDRDNLTEHKDKSCFSNGALEEDMEQLPSSKMVLRKEALVSNSFAPFSNEKRTQNLEAAKGQEHTTDNNVNKNESSEQNGFVLKQPSTSQNKSSDKNEKTAAFDLRSGVKKTLGRPVIGCDVGGFGQLGKKSAAKYKIMLENWTSQSIDKERNRSQKSLYTTKSKRPPANLLDFYQTQCNPYLRGEVCEQPGISFTSNAYERPQDSSNSGIGNTGRFPEVALQRHGIRQDNCYIAPPRFEVEEDADTEDGLLTAQKKSEIDAAVDQWLAFYEVNLPSASHDQYNVIHSLSPLDSDLLENVNNKWKLPELKAVGDVTHGELTKARSMWFQFYNITAQIQTQGTSRLNSPSSMGDCANSFRETRCVQGLGLENERHVNSEANSISSNKCDQSTSRFGSLRHENSPSSFSNANTSEVFSDALRKIALEKEINSKFCVGSAMSNVTDNFTFKLAEKLKALSNNSISAGTPGVLGSSDGKKLNSGGKMKIQRVTDAEMNKTATQEIFGVLPKESDYLLRTPSLNEFSFSEATRPSENISNIYPSLVNSDATLDLSFSSVDPAFIQVKENDTKIQFDQGGELQQPLGNKLLTARASAEDTRLHSYPDVSCSTPPTNSLMSGLDSIDIQICPPCSPTSSNSESSARKEMFQSKQSTVHEDRTSPRKAMDFSWASSSSDLASRLIESMSLKRRALMAELGLYHELLTGLIPMEWAMPRTTNDTTSDLETGRVKQSQSSRVPSEDTDPDLGSECPYCLHRTRKKHADMSQQVETNFRRLFGIKGGSFTDEEESNSNEESEKDENENQTYQMSGAMGKSEKFSFSQRGKFHQDRGSNMKRADSAVHTGEGQRRRSLRDSHGGLPRKPENADFNNSNKGQSAAVDPSDTIGLGTHQVNEQNEKSKKRGWLSWFDRGSFQTILLRDPMLALVVSHALIVFTQLVCWWPKTVINIYYDLYGFPSDQTSVEAIIRVIWYARLFLKPCVYLYYSKGYRENFKQILLTPIRHFKKQHSSQGV